MVNWKKLVKSIPFRVQVARGIFYEIVWCDDFPDGNTLGETRYNQRQIAIKKGLSPKLTVTTYLHEYAHALSGEYDIGLTETQILKGEQVLYYCLKPGNVFKK